MRPQLGHALQRQGRTHPRRIPDSCPSSRFSNPSGLPSSISCAGACGHCPLPDRAALHCRRTPLIGETVFFFDERMVCELCKPLRARRAAALGGRALGRARADRQAPRLRVISGSEMDPVTAHVLIGRPREEVFDYLADIANHQEFSDHYLKEWRLTRVESVGRGAGRALQDRRAAGPLRLGRHDLHRGRAARTGSSPRGARGSSTATRPGPPGRSSRRATRPAWRSPPSPSPRCPRTSSWRPSPAAAAGGSAGWARRCGACSRSSRRTSTAASAPPSAGL